MKQERLPEVVPVHDRRVRALGRLALLAGVDLLGFRRPTHGTGGEEQQEDQHALSVSPVDHARFGGVAVTPGAVQPARSEPMAKEAEEPGREVHRVAKEVVQRRELGFREREFRVATEARVGPDHLHAGRVAAVPLHVGEELPVVVRMLHDGADARGAGVRARDHLPELALELGQAIGKHAEKLHIVAGVEVHDLHHVPDGHIPFGDDPHRVDQRGGIVQKPEELVKTEVDAAHPVVLGGGRNDEEAKHVEAAEPHLQAGGHAREPEVDLETIDATAGFRKVEVQNERAGQPPHLGEDLARPAQRLRHQPPGGRDLPRGGRRRGIAEDHLHPVPSIGSPGYAPLMPRSAAFALTALCTTLPACVVDSHDESPPAPPQDSDTAGPLPCSEGDHAGLPAPWSADRGNNYRVVPVPLTAGGEGVVLVTWPPEGNTLWAEGAPVMVVSPPSHKVDETWVQHPQSWTRPAWGAVEVIAVWPGWTVQGTTAPGAGEGGGPAAAAAYDAALRFALGGPSSEGRPLADYAEVPVCNDTIALMSLSSGGAPLLQAVATGGADLAHRVAGISLFEPPSLPELAVAESGAIWMDPDLDDDADGDTLPWNDARNLDFDPASCTPAGCAGDMGTLAYTDERTLASLWSAYPADLPAGLLYFERSGDGTFNVDEHGRTDRNGDGRVDQNEDLWARPLFATSGDTYQVYYSDTMIDAAVLRGLLPLAATHIANPEATHAWWASRNMGLHAADAGAAMPDTLWSLVFTTMPHGPALVERTGETIVYDELVRGGAHPAWNFPADVAHCLAGDIFADYPGPPPDDPAPVGAELQAWAVPDTVNNVTTQAIGGLAPLLAARGWPTSCPESDE